MAEAKRRVDAMPTFNAPTFSYKRVVLAIAAALAISVGAATSADAASTPVPSFFGSKEIKANSLTKFTKWNEALARYSQEKPKELQKCQPTQTNPCHTARWRIFLNQIASLPKKDQLLQVNAYLNRWAYQVDPVLWNKKDYWATPLQFMYKTGDCEDYAISKYISLLHLGFKAEEMRIVVVQDLNLKIPHAILIVYLDGEPLVLDNQIKQVVHASRIRHYKPIYSINEQNWWLHRS
jgi:predicted transglutaminase-like cysteine proteinase